MCVVTLIFNFLNPLIMKKLLFTITMFSFLFWFSGCNEDPLLSSGSDDFAILNKAGTNLEFPNTFDVNGNLCINVNSPDDALVGKPMELWMGVGNEKAGTMVGHVTFLSGPDRVRIDLKDLDGDEVPDMYPYIVKVAHIHFGPTVDNIPHTKKGNPIVGLFEYNIDIESLTTVIEIPVEFDAVGAIHLEVGYVSGISGFALMLPDLVQMKVTHPGPDSYFQMTIWGDDAGDIAGVYDAWCVDIGTSISPGRTYDATLYSSYEEIPGGIVDNPENFDKINYLINHFESGQMIQPLDGSCLPVRDMEPLTYGDIQRAIWHYIDDNQHGVTGWNQERVNAITCFVDAGGEGFVPGCEQKIVFLVVPVENINEFQIVIGQPQISSLPIPCEEEEGGTAWGDGYWGATFPGSKQWGTWFNYGCE